jgi:hypothetical protein
MRGLLRVVISLLSVGRGVFGGQVFTESGRAH